MSVELYQFAVDWDLPSPSPFCLKMSTWLRLAGISYEVKAWTPGIAPHGKAPVVRVGDDWIGDSSCIVESLTERFSVTLDEGLSPAQRATGLLVQRTLEEHTYFALLNDRWLVDEVWATYRDVIGQPAPRALRRPFTAWLRRGVRAAVRAQGLGRHELSEVRARAIADVDAVLAVLGDQPFLLGEEPRSVDATVYAWFAILSHPIGQGAFAEHCRAQPALLAYVERMRERVWSDA
ncbi:MAG: glutathione S-transferase family protein [Myxococcales bacterium]|nr:glutathione S-transferase family protein [Myxococcales bacterium]